MKPRDIQRSVRSVRIERSAGDAPSIGRVSRVPGTGMPKGERRRRRRGEGPRGNRYHDNRKRVIFAWSALLMLIAMSILCYAVWVRVRPNGDPHSPQYGGNSQSVVEERVVSEFESPSEEEALVLVKRAMTVRDPRKVAELFRCGSATPEDITGFLRKMENLDGEISDYGWLSSMDANGMLLDGVQVNFRNLKGVRTRLAILTPDAKGRWQVDFDAFARTVTPPWSEIFEQKAAQAVVRVVVAPDSYYNGPFKDESIWTCYGMASPDHDTILMGYCRKDSAQAKAMKRIIAGAEMIEAGRKISRATLEIRRPEGGDGRQFEITRVLAQDWVLSDKPFDNAGR